MRLLGKRSYWQHVSPGGALRDFAAVWRENPHRWRVLAVSIALTATMLYGFLPENQRAEPRSPEISWITTFEPNRTDAEIVASNLEAQERKDEREALDAKRAELRKELYRELGRATFIDVDAMERQIAAEERAAAEKAAAARAQVRAGQPVAPAN